MINRKGLISFAIFCISFIGCKKEFNFFRSNFVGSRVIYSKIDGGNIVEIVFGYDGKNQIKFDFDHSTGYLLNLKYSEGLPKVTLFMKLVGGKVIVREYWRSYYESDVFWNLFSKIKTQYRLSEDIAEFQDNRSGVEYFAVPVDDLIKNGHSATDYFWFFRKSDGVFSGQLPKEPQKRWLLELGGERRYIDIEAANIQTIFAETTING